MQTIAVNEILYKHKYDNYTYRYYFIKKRLSTIVVKQPH